MPDQVYSLPDLPCDEGALEPYISGRIMGLHHDAIWNLVNWDDVGRRFTDARSARLAAS